MASGPLLGVLGGSFNPPHLGHLLIASGACDELGLERVLFVPAASPPHKMIDDDVSRLARVAMAELAVVDDLRFSVSALEVERELVYTRDTLRAVASRYPDHPLVFIMGSDSLLQFATWHDPQAILQEALLAVAPRPGDRPADVAAAATRWGRQRVRVLDTPLVDISSTGVRERVRGGRSIRYLVPAAVEEYIVAHALYAAP
ncbi:MAG: nicotinate-nucleotide adenylyltransferase [Thermoleophilia bacterium]